MVAYGASVAIPYLPDHRRFQEVYVGSPEVEIGPVGLSLYRRGTKASGKELPPSVIDPVATYSDRGAETGYNIAGPGAVATGHDLQGVSEDSRTPPA